MMLLVVWDLVIWISSVGELALTIDSTGGMIGFSAGKPLS
jgi:hypothetical protein